MKCVIHWRNSYPENAGHGRRFVALEVLLGKVSARLRKEPTNTFGKLTPHSRQYQSRLGFGPRDRECLERPQAFRPCKRFTALGAQIRGITKYPAMFRGAADRCWVAQESESNRKRWSVSKGTREARLSRAVTKHLPTRQPSGGAPVVVGDVNDARKAKGCRMIRVRMTEVFFNLEASK